jgi:hypothetical protein
MCLLHLFITHSKMNARGQVINSSTKGEGRSERINVIEITL